MSHWRARKTKSSNRAHALRIEKGFGITAEIYLMLYHAQDDRCFICRRATGKAKRLAVDHDHTKGCGHAPDIGCPGCIRALLCGPCNELVGRFDVAALARAITVLTNPPAQKILQGVS